MKKLILALTIVGAFLYVWNNTTNVPEFSDELNEIICIEEGI